MARPSSRAVNAGSTPSNRRLNAASTGVSEAMGARPQRQVRNHVADLGAVLFPEDDAVVDPDSGDVEFIEHRVPGHAFPGGGACPRMNPSDRPVVQSRPRSGPD